MSEAAPAPPPAEIQPPVEALPAYTEEWLTDIPGQQYSVAIKVPEAGHITGTLRVDDANDYRGVYVDLFAADENAPPGSGKALLHTLAHEASQYRATEMSGHFTSPAALGAFGSVVGRENVRFTVRHGEAATDVTFEEAMSDPTRYIATAPLPQEQPAVKAHDDYAIAA